MHPFFDKFIVHNLFWENLALFKKNDPQLKRISVLPYRFESSLITDIPVTTPGIYLIDGGRQVGKSTLVKQIMLRHLKEKTFKSENMIYLSGELISHADELYRILSQFTKDKTSRLFIAIDEINYIPDWDRIIKFMADAAVLDKATVILTGSNNIIIRDAMKRFPGRRGSASKSNFHYYPLSFYEFVNLRNKKTIQDIKILFEEFDIYLKTGGYLTAINDYALHQKIQISTLNIYKEWVFGDFLNMNKNQSYLREVLSGIFKRYGSQISWNSLSKDLSIDHHKTVADYCQILEQMDAVYIQSALLKHKLVAAPKKAKKIYFSDPFIFHALSADINGYDDPWQESISQANDMPYTSALIEGVVINHIRRFYPTYYIKEKQEIDVAFVKQKKYHPIEIKWTNQLRYDELKHLKNEPRAFVVAKVLKKTELDGIQVLPLPLFLMEWGREE